MGLFGNNEASGGMNLSQTGAPMGTGTAPMMGGMGMGMGMQPGQMNGFAQPQQQNGFMGGMMGGMGMSQQQQQMMQNGQFAPPSETEVLIQLLNSSVPVEKWLSGTNFQNVVSMFSNLMTLCIHNYFKQAKFTADEDGNLTIDVTSLPQDIQTVSVENVTMELQKVQSAAQQSIQSTQMQQHQIATMAQQNMMQSAFGAAMADPGMVSKAGGAVGGFARSLIGLPPSRGA
tara:strand:+ start:1848 stop:2537 length:690 start_codon:yes stop_codon:yes gene_type:complete